MCLLSRTRSVGTPPWWLLPFMFLLFCFEGISSPVLFLLMKHDGEEGDGNLLQLLWCARSCCC